MAAKLTTARSIPDSLDRRILDTALEQAERTSWEALRLRDVAEQLDLSLDDIRRRFREKEELAEAWFDRADAVMVQAAGSAAALPASDLGRIEDCVMAWLGTLSEHPRVTRQIVLGKLEPGHLHVQLSALLRISRTVQWIREAAGREGGHLHRPLDEALLTTIFVTTFCYWLADPRQDLSRTRRFLHRLLSTADTLGRLPPLSLLAVPLSRHRILSSPPED